MKLSTAILALAALAAEVFAVAARVAQHCALRSRRQEGVEVVAGVAVIGTSIAKPAPSASSASQPQAVAVAAALVTSSVAAAPTAIAAAAAEGGAATESASGAALASEPASASASNSGAAATTTSSKAKAAKETGGAKKASGGSAELDLTILQFANLAEQLESTLYSQAAAAFSAQDWLRAGFTEGQVLAIQESLTVIGREESTHETVLASVIKAAGSKAVSTCKFDFSVRSRSGGPG